MNITSECFISVGEYSGDLLAADLVVALKAMAPHMHFFGVTGQAMQRAGVESVASLDSLSVMGIWEVAAKLADIRMLEQELLAQIDRRSPQAAILVDFPGFHFRLAEQLKLRGIAVYQYVAPKVWAWGEGRLERLRRDFELVLGILPFESSYFAQHGVPYIYVGSPHKDRCDKVRLDRQSLGLEEKRPVVAFLPGSRLSEIKRLLPLMSAIKDKIKASHPAVQFIMPVAPNLSRADVMGCLTRPHELNAEVDQDFCLVDGMSLEVMALADVCCVASGTATLECALLGTPLVVVYAMSDLSYQVAKRKVKISAFSLVNIVLGGSIVSEFIQDFAVSDVAATMTELLTNEEKRCAMQAKFASLHTLLHGDAARTAASAFLASLNGEKRSGRLGP